MTHRSRCHASLIAHMKTPALLAVLVFALAATAAIAATAAVDSPPTPPKTLRELLQEALFEEEANRDLEKAAAAYAELIKDYDQQRAFAATALFRLAEIRAKEGKKEEAIALHQTPHRRVSESGGSGKTLTRKARRARRKCGAQMRFRVVSRGREETELKRVTELVAKTPDLINPAPASGSQAPLVTAADRGYLKVATFLLDHGAKVDGPFGGTPPLVKAADGKEEMVKLLLSRGADVNAADGNKSTPLEQAVKNKHLEIARILLDHNADPNIVTNEGYSPLGWAVGAARVDLATLLLDHGADPNLSPAYPNNSPLGLATSKGFEQMAALLLDRGAKINEQEPRRNDAADDRRDDGAWHGGFPARARGRPECGG